MAAPIPSEVQAFRSGVEELIAAQVTAAEADGNLWEGYDKIAKVGGGLVVFAFNQNEMDLMSPSIYPTTQKNWGIATEGPVLFPGCDVPGNFAVRSEEGPMGPEFVKTWRFPPRPGLIVGASIGTVDADPAEQYLQLLRDPRVDSPIFAELSRLDESHIPHILKWSGPGPAKTGP